MDDFIASIYHVIKFKLQRCHKVARHAMTH